MLVANYRLREQAIKLRLDGYTYSQIKQRLQIPKSTLSGWLRNLPLTNEQLHNLDLQKINSEAVRRERYRNTMSRKRLHQLKFIYDQQKLLLGNISQRELLIAGLFLYWGEGNKQLGTVCISNTDPKIIKFALYWLTETFQVPIEKIKIRLHLYPDMSSSEMIDYWKKQLNIPISCFGKPYYKNSNRSDLTYKSFGHGTCRIMTHSVDLSERIAMSLKSIAEEVGAWDENFWYNQLQ